MTHPIVFSMATHGAAAIACAIVGLVLWRNRALAVRLMFDGRVGLAAFLLVFAVAHVAAFAGAVCGSRLVGRITMAGFWLAGLVASFGMLGAAWRSRDK